LSDDVEKEDVWFESREGARKERDRCGGFDGLKRG
jgi:hypothetical protein